MNVGPSQSSARGVKALFGVAGLVTAGGFALAAYGMATKLIDPLWGAAGFGCGLMLMFYGALRQAAPAVGNAAETAGKHINRQLLQKSARMARGDRRFEEADQLQAEADALTEELYPRERGLSSRRQTQMTRTRVARPSATPPVIGPTR